MVGKKKKLTVLFFFYHITNEDRLKNKKRTCMMNLLPNDETEKKFEKTASGRLYTHKDNISSVKSVKGDGLLFISSFILRFQSCVTSV